MASVGLTVQNGLRKRCGQIYASRIWMEIVRKSSTTSEQGSTLLSRIKTDLKTAMKAKDTGRLNVLRAMISEVNQSASGSSPINSDMQMLAMLRKRKAASQTAAKEAEQAKRDDLKQKQEAEISILNEYAGSVKVVSAEDLRTIVKSALEVIAANTPVENIKPGILMKELLRPGGNLEGRPVDKAELAKLVQEVLKTNSKVA